MNLYKIISFLSLSLLLTACSEDMQRSLAPVPNAFGKLNEIIIIADDRIWEGPVGDTLRYYYGAAYPILPQPEPIFDLRQFTPGELDKDPIRKEFRNYMLLSNLNEDDSPTTQLMKADLKQERLDKAKNDPNYTSTVARDKWAKNQLLVYQFAYSDDDLIENIKKNFPAVAKRVQEADRAKIEATIYFGGENPAIQAEVADKMGTKIRVPSDYNLAISNEDLIWMRREIDNINSNLLIRKIGYTDQSQLSKQGIKAIRDSLGRAYVSSTLPDTYMRINDIDLPMFTSIKTLNNKYTLEARGIWEMVNDFMGGAFISYLIHNPEKEELLFVDGFVYAPGKEKRNFMQQLEFIMSTVEF
ncbi:MAG: DUF4837 family protein [Saprospiraceae bacterium]|nr:DUF4837 family protein [Saprospiraceae bacterium]